LAGVGFDYSAETTARFIPPMLLLRRECLPEGPAWLYELKLDGFRAVAIERRHSRSAVAQMARISKRGIPAS
jgi:ATP-dependent DNA ligase